MRRIPEPEEHCQLLGLSRSSDSSVSLFALYLRIAEVHDARRLKLLKGDTDQILVFVSFCVGNHYTTSSINSGASAVCSPPQLRH